MCRRHLARGQQNRSLLFEVSAPENMVFTECLCHSYRVSRSLPSDRPHHKGKVETPRSSRHLGRGKLWMQKSSIATSSPAQARGRGQWPWCQGGTNLTNLTIWPTRIGSPGNRPILQATPALLTALLKDRELLQATVSFLCGFAPVPRAPFQPHSPGLPRPKRLSRTRGVSEPTGTPWGGPERQPCAVLQVTTRPPRGCF